MALAVIGLSHRTAPVAVRERFAYDRGEVPAALGRLVESGVADEAVLLSTCNRTEIYVSASDVVSGSAAALSILAEHAGETAEASARYLYQHRDRSAVEHLFRVVAGLESMAVGEPQIQGQVKDAYNLARETTSAAGAVVGATANRLFQTALAVGGRVRSETGLGVGAASIPSAAVELSRKIFGSLKGRRALILGAGEMSEVTLECLRSAGVGSCLVANRTHERARDLAGRWGGEAIEFDEFASALSSVDILISSTAAATPVLTRDLFRGSNPSGVSRPLCIIDIGMPRDVETAMAEEANVFLYNIDDLRQIVDHNLGQRRGELPRAEAIIGEGVEEFWGWYVGLAVVPTIRDLRERSEAVRQAEVEKALRRLAHLAPEDQEAIDALTRGLLNKLLHMPTVRLREAAGNGRGTSVLDTVRYLFELDGEAEHGEAEDSPDSTEKEINR
ncbi:MAG TPA: glutamyl-tRNA reductase [Longimicrobiaceae bacterium]|nr:glutamyl-tRNA reductase [Longimicrobiaceae bacterium]